MNYYIETGMSGVMRRFWSIVLLASLLLALSFVYHGGFPEVKASPDMFQGDLILTGNNVTTIENMIFDINGSIIVQANATLILRNAILNFTQETDYQYNMTFQNPVDGYPRLIVENTSLASNSHYMSANFYENSTADTSKLSAYDRIRIYTYDNSSLIVSDSTFAYIQASDSSVIGITDSSFDGIYCEDSTKTSVQNCTFGQLEPDRKSEVTVTNCTIGYLVVIEARSINYSVVRYQPCFTSYWNFIKNCSVITTLNSEAPNVTLIDTQVDDWGFSSLGSSNLTVQDSMLLGLWGRSSSDIAVRNSTISYACWCEDNSTWHLNDTMTERLYSSEGSMIWLLNTTANEYRVLDNSQIWSSWYLDIHVLDAVGQDVHSANATAFYPNATVTESKLTDANGWARFPLMEKMLNDTGEYPAGNYTVEATYETHSNSTTVNMTSNQMITLMFSDYAAPTIESCNQVGYLKDSFELGETVHVIGSNYSQSTTYNVYIVVDVETWTDGMAIPERVPGAGVTVASYMNGDLVLTALWTTQTVGKFDIVVDVNGNGQYDPGIDALDDGDIEVTAGFSVIPELSSSLILTLFMIATLLMIAVPKSLIPKRARTK
jgi:hypothetical protein